MVWSVTKNNAFGGEKQNKKSKGEQSDLCDLEQVTLKPQLQVHHCLTTWLQIWYYSLLWGDSIRKGADLKKQNCLFGVHPAVMGKSTTLLTVFICSYLNFLVRMVASKQPIGGPCSLLGPMSSLTDLSNAVVPLFKRAVFHLFSSVSPEEESANHVTPTDTNLLSSFHHGCHTVHEQLERLCAVVLPNLVLESRIKVTELLLQMFPSNLYLLRM